LPVFERFSARFELKIPFFASNFQCTLKTAPHQNGEIVNHRNRLHFEEDDQFIGGSTAVYRMISAMC
jgi:hypothetical protein